MQEVTYKSQIESEPQGLANCVLVHKKPYFSVKFFDGSNNVEIIHATPFFITDDEIIFLRTLNGESANVSFQILGNRPDLATANDLGPTSAHIGAVTLLVFFLLLLVYMRSPTKERRA